MRLKCSQAFVFLSGAKQRHIGCFQCFRGVKRLFDLVCNSLQFTALLYGDSQFRFNFGKAHSRILQLIDQCWLLLEEILERYH